jgi:PAS domain S-box-containing protein
MKLLSYTWVRHTQFNQIQHELNIRKAQMQVAGQFIHEIEQGNLDATYKQINTNSAGDELSLSLISMRDKMKKISLEENQRNWVTEGLAKFVEILRSKNNNLLELSDNIISNLVKYMNANQGALYRINDDDSNDEFIELIACYAYGRKKHLNQRIEFGEGLVGQAVFEKSTIYMTNIPANYIKITSGLGEALPRNILLVPLKLDDKIFGVVEIASFEIISPYQILFVEKLSESIASTIASVKVNQKTSDLLRETQVQAEQMRAQEEEMRQNMEELTATQEEMQRILKEVQGQERYMNELIDSSTDSILVVDTDFKVISANKTLLQSYSAMGVEVNKGFDVLNLFNEKERGKYKEFYERALGGESFQLTEQYQSHGFDSYFLIQYTPIRKNDGAVMAAAVFAKDISEMMKAHKNSEAMAFEAQQRNEELKAQEEELRQNMEELAATQDEMQRIILEVQAKEKYLDDIINISTDVIFTVDKEYKVLSFNKAMASGMELLGIKLAKGFCILSIFPEDKYNHQKANYDRAFAGESFQLTEHFNQQGLDVYSLINHAPIRNEKGEVFAVVVFSKDVSEMQRTLRDVKQKETDLYELINASTDSIWTVNTDYKLLTFNKNFENIFTARNVAVVKGVDMISILPEEEQKIQIEIYSRVFAGETLELTQTFTYQNEDTHVMLNYSALRNEKQEICGAAVYAKNITAQVNAQRKTEYLLNELKRQDEIHKVLGSEQLCTSSTMMMEIDLSGTITGVDEGLLKISGYTQKELIGKPDKMLWYPDMPEKLFSLLWSTIKTGNVFKFMQKNRAKNGKFFWTETTVIPAKNENKKIEKYLFMKYHFTDETIAGLMHEKQMREWSIPVHSNNTVNKVVRNGHHRMKAA